MTRQNLPTYAIVELLIRLSHIDHSIGDYKDHIIFDEGVIVKTTKGNISFSKVMIMQQFNDPESIADDELFKIAKTFKSLR